ncbi:uncharacterized protein LOC123262678 [Cotesia glomerata]|nr:uncharacterized protein LOC123262678 [Cotesia glomerata]
MAGAWYEAERSTNNYDGMDECTRFVWYPQPQNNSAILIYNAVSGLYDMTSKTISVADPTNEGIAITYHVPTLGNVVRNRVFLDVNYDDHVIFYTCEEIGGGHYETAWVHSRNRTTGPRMEAILKDAFARYNLNVPVMHTQDNSACNYDSYDVTCA